MFKKLIHTDNSQTTIIIQLMVGALFLSVGIKKFLFRDIRGTGRFERIGLPHPEFTGSFAGTFEILCGPLILIGSLTRLASIQSRIIMPIAIAPIKGDFYLENEATKQNRQIYIALHNFSSNQRWQLWTA